ncbi:unnamed protein product [Boreogadus saida]
MIDKSPADEHMRDKADGAAAPTHARELICDTMAVCHRTFISLALVEARGRLMAVSLLPAAGRKRIIGSGVETHRGRAGRVPDDSAPPPTYSVDVCSFKV